MYVVAKLTICEPVSKRKVMTLVIDVSPSSAKVGVLTLSEKTPLALGSLVTPSTSPLELKAASVPVPWAMPLIKMLAPKLAELSPTFS
jgi:hypothetical protein